MSALIRVTFIADTRQPPRVEWFKDADRNAINLAADAFRDHGMAIIDEFPEPKSIGEWIRLLNQHATIHPNTRQRLTRVITGTNENGA